MTAPHIYPLWYYCLGVLTTLILPRVYKRKTTWNEIERIVKTKITTNIHN